VVGLLAVGRRLRAQAFSVKGCCTRGTSGVSSAGGGRPDPGRRGPSTLGVCSTACARSLLRGRRLELTPTDSAADWPAAPARPGLHGAPAQLTPPSVGAIVLERNDRTPLKTLRKKLGDLHVIETVAVSASASRRW